VGFSGILLFLYVSQAIFEAVFEMLQVNIFTHRLDLLQ